MDDKDLALDTLTLTLDEFTAQALAEFKQQDMRVEVKRIDYLTRTIVMEIQAGEASVQKLNEIGIKMHKEWPAMPDVNAALSEGFTEYPVLTFVLGHE